MCWNVGILHLYSNGSCGNWSLIFEIIIRISAYFLKHPSVFTGIYITWNCLDSLEFVNCRIWKKKVWFGPILHFEKPLEVHIQNCKFHSIFYNSTRNLLNYIVNFRIHCLTSILEFLRIHLLCVNSWYCGSNMNLSISFIIFWKKESVSKCWHTV